MPMLLWSAHDGPLEINTATGVAQICQNSFSLQVQAIGSLFELDGASPVFLVLLVLVL